MKLIVIHICQQNVSDNFEFSFTEDCMLRVRLSRKYFPISVKNLPMRITPMVFQGIVAVKSITADAPELN